MRRKFMLSLVTLFVACSLFAQTSTDKPAMISEAMYILPKRGMEEKFEAAVKAHNAKFHPDGPYVAGLRKVEYGKKAGWYVWVYGPTTYASLDTRPAKENGHAADWDATVEPLVETYGETGLWERNEKLSYGVDILKTAKYVEVWMVNLKDDQYYRFKAMAEKLQKTYESIGTTAFVVLNNAIHTSGGADVALLWSFNSYGEWAKDTGTKAAFEKLYGANSWQNMLDEWDDVLIDYDTELRSFIR
jgi:hypothetical protein